MPSTPLMRVVHLFAGMLLGAAGVPAHADETCQSPYMAKIVGQEDFVYVWTLGVPGLGDEQDKLVTVDVNPASPKYGRVVHQISVPGRNEAHHAGFTDDRRYLWAGGLDNSRIFIFDMFTDPAAPRLHKTLGDFSSSSGGIAGPHTFYALPGRMLITGLSNAQDRHGRTGMVEYNNAGEYVASYWMPTEENLGGATKAGRFADGYGYDVRALPRRNVMVTSSFTGWNNYMMNLGRLMADKEAMARFGNTAVVWNLHTRQPKTVLDVPGAPLEIRCAWGSYNNYCFTTTALTSKIWLIYEDRKGQWRGKAVADIGDPKKTPLPVDISISADDALLWVNTWNDGMTHVFDVKDPYGPMEIYTEKIGAQVNMLSESWDGRRIYFTSSLLANWDKTGAPKGEDLQFFKAYTWDGKKLTHRFTVDFFGEKLGRPHQMNLGAYSLYAQRRPADSLAVLR
ncbi:MAG: selenium-binding protein [Gammaproteobacteria bacterium]|nr:selenium-binding protein [Gammaproteobacteria bacterium]